MTTWLPRWFTYLVLLLPFVAAAGPDDAEIARLVKQLGSSDYRVREAATKRLQEIGKPALDALAKATTPLETRRRAEEIVVVIENKLYPELILTGHTGWVWTVSVSADGKRLLTASADKTLRLWDADTGKCLRVFEGHTDAVMGAALSPDGKRVLSGSRDSTVRLWDAATGKELVKMIGHAGSVICVCFGPEGKAISGSSDKTMRLRLWDLNTGKNTGVFTGANAAREVAYSARAKLAVTCSISGPIHLWNLETGKEVPNRIAEDFNVYSVCFSPDGKRLMTAAMGKTLRLWDVETGKELLRINDVNACGAAFSPDGTRVVSGGTDGIVRLWDAATGKELRKYEGHAEYPAGQLWSVVFFPDGKRIASASFDGTVRIWRAPR